LFSVWLVGMLLAGPRLLLAMADSSAWMSERGRSPDPGGATKRRRLDGPSDLPLEGAPVKRKSTEGEAHVGQDDFQPKRVCMESDRPHTPVSCDGAASASRQNDPLALVPYHSARPASLPLVSASLFPTILPPPPSLWPPWMPSLPPRHESVFGETPAQRKKDRELALVLYHP
jgi:hypothetical protein